MVMKLLKTYSELDEDVTHFDYITNGYLHYRNCEEAYTTISVQGFSIPVHECGSYTRKVKQ